MALPPGPRIGPVLGQTAACVGTPTVFRPRIPDVPREQSRGVPPAIPMGESEHDRVAADDCG